MADKVLHAIGVKILKPEMMRCNFKHTDSVLHTIERFRSIAEKEHDSFCDRLINDPNDALMTARGYNNAISILGSRGSGKTSIIMTLQYILRYGQKAWEENQSQDLSEIRGNILMPILVPQDFVPGQDLLSWVIAQLITQAEKVEREYNGCITIPYGKQGPFAKWIENKCDKQFSDPLQECVDSLKNSYELRYKSINQSCDQSNHVYQYIDEVKRDAKLVEDMLKLISMLTDYYRYVNSKEPLIFFVIDDLDLAPERSQEVLNLVLRYLQHPNIVVLCGWNQELFQTHLTMQILRNQGIEDAGMIDVNGDYIDVFTTRQKKKVSLLDSARRLSMDNLKKAFPPALRYEVRGLNSEQKSIFPMDKFVPYTDEEEYGSFIDLIEKALLASRPPLRRKTDKTENDKVSFLHTPQNEWIKVYMRIFDNKCRGLINVYHAFQTLKAFFDERQNRNEQVDLTSKLQSLLDTILFSNTHFVPYRRGLRDLIKIDKVILQPIGSDEKCVCEYYCNYQQILPKLNEYRDKLKLVEGEAYINNDAYEIESIYNYFPSLILDVFILLNFMENLLRYICGLPLYEHGGLSFSSALNDIIPPIQIVMDDKAGDSNMLIYAILSANIREIYLFPDTDDFRINLRLLDAYEKNGFCDGQYDFTGSYSYCRLSKAISSLLRKEGEEPEKRDKNGLPIIDKELLNKMVTNSTWMRTMYSLFQNLLFNEKNVSRLSRFRCFARQCIYTEDDELIENASIEYETNISDSHKINAVYLKKSVNNADLECLVNTLRELDKLKIRMLMPADFKEAEDESSTKIYKGKDDTLNAKGSKALEFINTFARNAYTLKMEWITPSAYYKKITYISRLKTDNTNSGMYDMAIAEECDRCVIGVEKLLLWNLKMRLYCAFYRQYNLRETITERYEYLLKASTAISRYLVRWQIGHRYWSVIEQDAVDRLVSIFTDKRYMEALRYTRAIAQYGPRIQETSRDKYIKALENLKRWMSGNRNRFKSADQEMIVEDIGILQRAGRAVARTIDTDKDIEDVLEELGKAIAEESAQMAFCEELTKDKSSNEREKVTWPIISTSRLSFENWKDVGLGVNCNSEISSVNSTFFD